MTYNYTCTNCGFQLETRESEICPECSQKSCVLGNEYLEGKLKEVIQVPAEEFPYGLKETLSEEGRQELVEIFKKYQADFVKQIGSVNGLGVNEAGILSGSFMVSNSDNSTTKIDFRKDGVFRVIETILKRSMRTTERLLSPAQIRLIGVSYLPHDFGTGFMTCARLEVILPNGKLIPFNGPIQQLPEFLFQLGRAANKGLEQLGMAFTTLADNGLVKSELGLPGFGLFSAGDKIVFADNKTIPVLAGYEAVRNETDLVSERLANPVGNLKEIEKPLAEFCELYETSFPQYPPFLLGWFGASPLAYIFREGETALFPHLGLEGGKQLGKSVSARTFASLFGRPDEISGETLNSPFRTLSVVGVGGPVVVNEGDYQNKGFGVELLKPIATQPMASMRGKGDLSSIRMLSLGALAETSNVPIIHRSKNAQGALADRYLIMELPEAKLKEDFRKDNFKKKTQFDQIVKRLHGKTIFGALYYRWLADNITTIDLFKEVRRAETEFIKSPLLLSRKPLIYAQVWLGASFLKRFLTEKGVQVPKCLEYPPEDKEGLETFKKWAEANESKERLPSTVGYEVAVILASIVRSFDAGITVKTSYQNEEEQIIDRQAREIASGKNGVFFDSIKDTEERVLISSAGLHWLNRELEKQGLSEASSSLPTLMDKLKEAWKVEGLSPNSISSGCYSWEGRDIRAIKLSAKEIQQVADRTGTQQKIGGNEQ